MSGPVVPLTIDAVMGGRASLDRGSNELLGPFWGSFLAARPPTSEETHRLRKGPPADGQMGRDCSRRRSHLRVYFAHSHAASAAKVAACLTHAGATVKHSAFLEDSLAAAG